MVYDLQQGLGGVHDDDWANLAAYQWPEPRQLFHQGVWHGIAASGSCLAVLVCAVKGVYMSWSNNPSNNRKKGGSDCCVRTASAVKAGVILG